MRHLFMAISGSFRPISFQFHPFLDDATESGQEERIPS
jgi:hypothetical protein